MFEYNEIINTGIPHPDLRLPVPNALMTDGSLQLKIAKENQLSSLIRLI